MGIEVFSLLIMRRFGDRGEHDHSGLQRVISENSQLNRIQSGGSGFARQVSVEGAMRAVMAKMRERTIQMSLPVFLSVLKSKLFACDFCKIQILSR